MLKHKNVKQQQMQNEIDTLKTQLEAAQSKLASPSPSSASASSSSKKKKKYVPLSKPPASPSASPYSSPSAPAASPRRSSKPISVSSRLLVPTASGIEALAWALPATAFVFGVAGLTIAFRRWQESARRLGAATDEDYALVAQALDNDDSLDRDES